MTSWNRSPLLLVGALVGAVTAVALAARRSATAGPSPRDEQLLALTDEQHWLYETSVEVHRPSGAVAGHLHRRGGLPGLAGPLDGPPMSRVDWQEPGGALLRAEVHGLSGGDRSEVRVQVARGSRALGVGGLAGLESEVRSHLTALRKELERAR